MGMVPIVASADDLPEALRYATLHPSARWYVASRADALGRSADVPDGWGAPVVAAAEAEAPGAPEAADPDPATEVELTDDEMVNPLVASVSITAEERRKAADSGAALPDGSFPIRNRAELHKAVNLRKNGTASEEKVVGHIRKRAKDLGFEDDEKVVALTAAFGHHEGGPLHEAGKLFNEAMHPRGRDGQFITKGGRVVVIGGDGHKVEGTVEKVDVDATGKAQVHVKTAQGNLTAPAHSIEQAPTAKAHVVAPVEGTGNLTPRSTTANAATRKANEAGTAYAHRKAAELHGKAAERSTGGLAVEHHRAAAEHVSAANKYREAEQAHRDAAVDRLTGNVPERRHSDMTESELHRHIAEGDEGAKAELKVRRDRFEANARRERPAAPPASDHEGPHPDDMPDHAVAPAATHAVGDRVTHTPTGHSGTVREAHGDGTATVEFDRKGGVGGYSRSSTSDLQRHENQPAPRPTPTTHPETPTPHPADERGPTPEERYADIARGYTPERLLHDHAMAHGANKYGSHDSQTGILRDEAARRVPERDRQVVKDLMVRHAQAVEANKYGSHDDAIRGHEAALKAFLDDKQKPIRLEGNDSINLSTGEVTRRPKAEASPSAATGPSHVHFGPRRHEFHDEGANSHKFYESSVIAHSDGTASHVTSWGRIGAKPSYKADQHPDVASAFAAHDKKMAAQERKGYVDIGGSTDTGSAHIAAADRARGGAPARATQEPNPDRHDAEAIGHVEAGWGSHAEAVKAHEAGRPSQALEHVANGRESAEKLHQMGRHDAANDLGTALDGVEGQAGNNVAERGGSPTPYDQHAEEAQRLDEEASANPSAEASRAAAAAHGRAADHAPDLTTAGLHNGIADRHLRDAEAHDAREEGRPDDVASLGTPGPSPHDNHALHGVGKSAVNKGVSDEATAKSRINQILGNENHEQAHRDLAAMMSEAKLGGKQRARYRELLNQHHGIEGGGRPAGSLSADNPVKERLAAAQARIRGGHPDTGTHPADTRAAQQELVQNTSELGNGFGSQPGAAEMAQHLDQTRNDRPGGVHPARALSNELEASREYHPLQHYSQSALKEFAKGVDRPVGTAKIGQMPASDVPAAARERLQQIEAERGRIKHAVSSWTDDELRTASSNSDHRGIDNAARNELTRRKSAESTPAADEGGGISEGFNFAGAAEHYQSGQKGGYPSVAVKSDGKVHVQGHHVGTVRATNEQSRKGWRSYDETGQAIPGAFSRTKAEAIGEVLDHKGHAVSAEDARNAPSSTTAHEALKEREGANYLNRSAETKKAMRAQERNNPGGLLGDDATKRANMEKLASSYSDRELGAAINRYPAGTEAGDVARAEKAKRTAPGDRSNTGLAPIGRTTPTSHPDVPDSPAWHTTHHEEEYAGEPTGGLQPIHQTEINGHHILVDEPHTGEGWRYAITPKGDDFAHVRSDDDKSRNLPDHPLSGNFRTADEAKQAAIARARTLRNDAEERDANHRFHEEGLANQVQRERAGRASGDANTIEDAVASQRYHRENIAPLREQGAIPSRSFSTLTNAEQSQLISRFTPAAGSKRDRTANALRFYVEAKSKQERATHGDRGSGLYTDTDRQRLANAEARLKELGIDPKKIRETAQRMIGGPATS